MTGPEEAPVPRLRRDAESSANSGRRVVLAVAVVFLLLLGFVLTLVFTIGLHNNGVKPPLGEPTSTSQ